MSDSKKHPAESLIEAVRHVAYCGGCSVIAAGAMILYGLSLVADKL